MKQNDYEMRLNTFTFRLLRHQQTINRTNIVLSPASIIFSLAILANCAEGATRKTILKTIGFDGLELELVNKFLSSLLIYWKNDDSALLFDTATRIWVTSSEISQTLIDTMKTLFNAKIGTTKHTDTVQKINGWVSEATHGMIPQAVDPLDFAVGAVLLNIVYFCGFWVYPFDHTYPQDFHLLDGSIRLHPLMFVSGQWNYYTDSMVQVVELPYKNRNTMSMIVVLPTIPWADFLALLDADHWNQWLSGMRERDGSIYLPRFKASLASELIDPLIKCGLGPAVEHGDYRPLGVSSLPISNILHRVWLEVDELGSRAAAITSVALGFNPSAFKMRVDRPFFCAIRDNRSGIIVFLGLITDPDVL